MHKELIPPLLALAQQAGAAIRDIYQQRDFEQFTKSDETPVTSADLAANAVLIKGLAELGVDYPILSEESDHLSLSRRAQWQTYWLIDPLDGTGEFIQRSDEFAVNIALIHNHEPVLGVIYAPILDIAYYGIKGEGAFKVANGQPLPIESRKLATQTRELTFAISRRQDRNVLTSRIAEEYHAKFIPLGSATLKACMVAEGVADAYVRLGPTGEWDTGAAECIVREAGGCIMDLTMQPLTYNQRETLINPDFAVVGDPAFRWVDIIRS